MLNERCSRWADKAEKSFLIPARALYSTSSAPWWWINALLLSFYCHFIALVQFTRLYVPPLSGGATRMRTRPTFLNKGHAHPATAHACRTHNTTHTQHNAHTHTLNQEHDSFKHKWGTIQASRWKSRLWIFLRADGLHTLFCRVPLSPPEGNISQAALQLPDAAALVLK